MFTITEIFSTKSVHFEFKLETENKLRRIIILETKKSMWTIQTEGVTFNFGVEENESMRRNTDRKAP